MAKIQCRKGSSGSRQIRVNQRFHSFDYVRPADKDLRREGRTLTISTPTEFGTNSIRLNGTQIHTLKRILQEAGEIPETIDV